MTATPAADTPAPGAVARPDVIHLERAGTSVVVDSRGGGMPVIVYWGASLGDVGERELVSLCDASLPQRVSGGLDLPTRMTLLPAEAEGWQFEPGLVGARIDGTSPSPLFVPDAVESDAHSIAVRATDAEARLSVAIELSVGAGGLLRQRVSLLNEGDIAYDVHSLTLGFPLPVTATELFDTNGRHLKERSPQRHGFAVGEYSRTSRRGRPGADASLLLLAGQHGFGFRAGTVHGVHVAWSGDHRMTAVRTPSADRYLTGGELLLPGEGLLAPGQSYSSPWVVGSWGDGLDELAGRFHDELRARPGHPSSPRPVTLNTWEAVYFDHHLPRLTELADRGAELGVERFVLDDGWFLARRDDTAGLGDWYVDPAVWPEGLHPLVDHVRARGMEFGLWVEPEMVNPDSDLAREHPDWILKPANRWPVPARQQQVIDLAHPDAYAYILERLDAILAEYDIAYLKWDHNRDLLEALSQQTGRAGVHATTAALYRLLDELRSRHPGVEIESCASGGARVDLGILERTDRIWTSDSTDPLERLDNQAYTGLLVPNELLGAHVGSQHVHTTDRMLDLDLRAGVAVFGHFGIEWDISGLDEESSARLKRWVEFYVANRDLFHTGRSVHSDAADPSIDLRGVVAGDRSRAIYALTQRSASVTYPVGHVTLPGLDDERVYEIALSGPTTELPGPGQSPLTWATTAAPVRMTGRMLRLAGIQAPVQYPEALVMISATAV